MSDRDEYVELLPEGWASTCLEAVVAGVQPGFACGANNRGGDGVAHLRPMNVSTEGEIDLSDVKYISAEEADSDRKWLRCGDVLFNNTNSTELVGKTAVYEEDEPRAFSNHMTRVRVCAEALDPKYCATYLHHCWREGYFQGVCNQHVSQSSVSRTRLLATPIDLPPLAEQKRIVAKVEALLERVNKARQRLDRVPEILKQFRQSVLAAACSGRLTADWREESGVIEEWTTATLGDVGTVSGGITKNARRSSLPLKVPYLRVANVYANRLELSEVHTIGVTDAEFARTRLEEGDLLFVEGNGSIDQIGRVAIWDGSVDDCVHQNHLIRFRSSDKAVPRYIVYFMMSQRGRDSLMEKAVSTAGLHSLSISKIAAVEVEIPPLAEQVEIVRQVEGILAATDVIESRVIVGIGRTERITQAILAKGFAGELVETEADLARREGRDYEPASMLLQRVAVGSSAASTAVQLERGRAVLDILLLLEAWNQPVSISALEPALVLMRNDAARQVLLNGRATRRRRRSLSNEPQFVRGLDVIYTGLVANGAIRRVGQSGFELANSQLLAQASTADRTKAAEVIRAIQTLSDLRSLPQAVASITHEQYEITV